MIVVATIITLSVLGLLFGLLLAGGSRIFSVKVDPRLENLIALLPGANCGACGFSGCADCASAILEGTAAPDACPVASSAVHRQVAELLGRKISKEEKLTARIFCRGGESSARSYRYEGIETCAAADQLGGGEITCSSGCLRYYTCRDVCPFNAITVDEKGNPVVLATECRACGICVQACPRGIIRLVDASSRVDVFCSSPAPGKEVVRVCSTGCIACGLCVKACPVGAIKIVENLARIDYQKCVACGKCVEACPRDIIKNVSGKRQTVSGKR